LLGQFQHPVTRGWAETIATFDGFVIVTPEYNHGMPGVLKNALDSVHAGWNDKAAGFVSYGVDGGARAVEQLRLTCGALQMADVTQQVTLSLHADFEDRTRFRPSEYRVIALHRMLDQLVSWSSVLAPLRSARPAA
jgi:NAD(P)H-dependent FMN reductase